MKPYVIMDIDDTLSDTVPVWIRRYNRKWNDKLKVSSIQKWDISAYVVPECGNKVYDLLQSKTLYNYIKPLPHALDGINLFRQLGFEIVYATGGTPRGSVYKYDWLKTHGFWRRGDHYVQTASKFLLRGDLIVDDNYETISKFSGFSLLIDQPWNWEFEHPNRMKGWKPIIENIHTYREIIL